MSAETPYPGHLRPVPDSGGSAAPALDGSQVGGTLGLTPPRTRGHSRSFVTDVLVELGFVGAETVQAAVDASRTAGRPPEALLVEQGAISGDQLSRAVAERYGLDHVDLSSYQVDVAAAALFPVTMARRYKAVPVGFVDAKTLLVAAVDPANVLAADDIQIATGLDCRIAVAAEDDVEALLARLGTLQSAAAEAIVEDQHRVEEEERAASARGGQRDAGQRRGRAGDQARLQHPRPGGGGGGLRHPPRTRRGRAADPLPRRRRAEGIGARAEADDQRRDLAPEDHERARHRREAGAAGRSRQRRGRGPPHRSARYDPSHLPRRGGDDPHPRRGQCPALARRPRHGRLRPRPLRGRLPAGLRCGAGDRADRLGQVDHPLRRSGRS